MKLFAPVLIAIGIIWTSNSNALEMFYENKNPVDGTPTDVYFLILKGEIEPGDYDKLVDFTSHGKIDGMMRLDKFWGRGDIILASPGGDIEEALNIANYIKGTYSGVFVGDHYGKCASACFFIYASAIRRDANTDSLGIHRPYIHPDRLKVLSIKDAEILQKKTFAHAREFLLDKEIPTSLIDKMFNTASTEVYWLPTKEVDDNIGLYPAWYEQILITKCGLDTDMYNLFRQGKGNSFILDHLHQVNQCGKKLTRSESLNFQLKEMRALVDRRKSQDDTY